MTHTIPTNFPDEEYLQDLAEHTRKKFEEHHGALDQLLAYSGAVLNWVADYVTDPNVRWTREEIATDQLYLTGMGPAENEYIIRQAERSPEKLRQLLLHDDGAKALFSKLTFDPRPVMLRFEDDKYKVLNGMHRVIGAIKESRDTVTAYVARLQGTPAPQCEPHVVYDLLRVYERGNTDDAEALVAALRFLRRHYSNVDMLLRERFSREWMQNEKVTAVIDSALMDA